MKKFSAYVYGNMCVLDEAIYSISRAVYFGPCLCGCVPVVIVSSSVGRASFAPKHIRRALAEWQKIQFHKHIARMRAKEGENVFYVSQRR